MTPEQQDEPTDHAGGIPSSPALRLQIVRDYASRVYGKELAAAAWLGQPHPSVLNGECIVATACQTTEGFRQTMNELSRIDKLRAADDLWPAPGVSIVTREDDPKRL
ncbi:MAG TPA: hypothetical protein VM240_00315 [Verrucomicrobiae bacterium]|nr:hypothetical protein [Verrucomicrobiae bacterium]